MRGKITWSWRAAAAALCLCAAPAFAQTNSDFFNPHVLHEVRLDINPSDWQALRDRYIDDTYYSCDFRWRYQGRDITVSNIAIRSRGTDSRSPFKPSLRVDFNRNDPNQQFLGLRSVVLKNNTQDASQLHNRLSIQFFRSMGLPASREAHARLFVNEQYVGLYLIVEEIRSELLRFNFGEDSGQLWSYNWVRGQPYYFDYLGPDPSLYTPKFFKAETNETRPDNATLVEMIRLINQTSDSEFQRVLGEYLDLKRVMAHIAVDGFVAEGDEVLDNNLFLYVFAGKKLFQWMPWDKDGTFYSVFHPIFWDRRNILIRRALTYPELRTAYLRFLAKAMVLAGGPGGWLEQEVDRAYNQVREAALADPNKQCTGPDGRLKPCSNEEFEAAVAALQDFARRRSDFIRQQLVDAGLEMRVTNAATFIPTELAPGSLITVFGEGLAGTTAQATAIPLPTNLGGVSVTIGGVEAPLLFVSPGQLNLQVPWGLAAGPASLVVTVNGAAREPMAVTVGTVSPGVFVVVHADTNRLVTADNPAASGEVLVVYSNGLGPVTVSVPSGNASPPDPLARTVQSPAVTLAGLPVEILFSGLTPGLVGLYQINVRLPANVSPGSRTPLMVSIGGESALPVFLAIR